MSSTPPSLTALASRIWLRDPSVFLAAGASESARAAVSQRLGWLDAPVTMAAELPAIEAIAASLRADGLDEAYLLGMGGSSLCAEVLRDVAQTTSVRLTVLDTTDEAAIASATASLTHARSVFIVASKSGSTVEVASLERYFWQVMSAVRGPGTGRHFLAITDPETSLGALAAERRYRHTFVNPADIGGRFSALSLFGLVPATLVGLPAARLLDAARAMADACRIEGPDNPALALGAFMADRAREGRDKLTVLLPARLAALGAWIEQLVAESTGKSGRGVLPVVDEPLRTPAEYGSDRAFVLTSFPDAPPDDETARALQAGGHPVFRIAADEVAGEFFRWEFATAVAGAMLAVNPFDEPNVRDAKERTWQQLEDRRGLGRFRVEPPLANEDGFAWRRHAGTTAADRARYVAILDYLPADGDSRAAMAETIAAVRAGRPTAVTHGIGPRYLHSTGQYHKGGPNTGVFLLFTADDRTSTPVPEADYTFSALKQAQALGDFEALAAAGRRVIHYHLADPAAGLAAARAHLLDQLDE
jgi:glucose-6-phosphate isomerase